MGCNCGAPQAKVSLRHSLGWSIHSPVALSAIRMTTPVNVTIVSVTAQDRHRVGLRRLSRSDTSSIGAASFTRRLARGSCLKPTTELLVRMRTGTSSSFSQRSGSRPCRIGLASCSCAHQNRLEISPGDRQAVALEALIQMSSSCGEVLRNMSFPQRACQPKELKLPYQASDESCTSAAAQRKGRLQADDSHGPRLQKCATLA